MGITGECKIVFQQGPYLIAVVTILKADLNKLITKSAGKEKAGKFGLLMEMIGTQSVVESIESSMVETIATKLTDVLPIKLRDQFAAKGLEVTIVAKTETEQAKYMFNMLHNLEEKQPAVEE
jgi:PhoPQ-activated pathogenicity-related protein